MDGRFYPNLIIATLMLAGLAGCSDHETTPTDPGGDPLSSVTIQMTTDPRVAFDAQTGKTTTVVQFIARDGDGYALAPDDVEVELLVDGQSVDNESILEEDAEELTASIHLSLVLDASYSMLLHDPPAFAPMLQAARDAILQGFDLYDGRSGTFSWHVTWFNEQLQYPTSGGPSWQPDDLLAIPAPGPGTATKLFAAVHREAERMTALHEQEAIGPNDHHILAVFSDGADNYSWFDNASESSTGQTAGGAPFTVSGYGPTTVEMATAAIEAHPRLTCYVMGLGSQVRDAQLQALSEAGGGRYFKNPSSSQVGALFELVTREFATIQNHGATIPLPPGDYTFGLRVWSDDRQAHDVVTFPIHAGDIAAAPLD